MSGDAIGLGRVFAGMLNILIHVTTKILILISHDQGGQIMDNALCGGGDPGAGISDASVPIFSSAAAMIKAAIFMGDPRYEYGFSYEVGTCRAGGVS